MTNIPGAFFTMAHGPVYAYSCAGRVARCVTWDGKTILHWAPHLRPMPATPAGAPDYSVPGVSQIVELEVDLGETQASTRGRAVKSPLYAKLPGGHFWPIAIPESED